MTRPTISILICTLDRPQQLAWLLDDVARQTRQPDEVVVVDNDAAAGARAVVEAFRAVAPFPVIYDVEPEKGISQARNRTVQRARGDWLGFLDDDERVPPDWLAVMSDCARQHHADGVLGPLLRIAPRDAPDWIRRGRHYDLPRARTGTVLPWKHLWFGNALLRADRVRAEAVPFDLALGLSGGEDGDLLMRLASRGAKFVWCDEAAVTEPIAPTRLTLRWILQRAYSGGQVSTTHWRNARRGRFGPALRERSWPLYAARALAATLVAGAATLCLMPAGRLRWVPWARKLFANAGKLAALAGARYEEYARPQGPSPTPGAESRRR